MEEIVQDEVLIKRYDKLLKSRRRFYCYRTPKIRLYSDDLYQEGVLMLLRNKHKLTKEHSSTIAWNLISQGMRDFIRRTTKIKLDKAHKDFSEIIESAHMRHEKSSFEEDDQISEIEQSVQPFDFESKDLYDKISLLADKILTPYHKKLVFLDIAPGRNRKAGFDEALTHSQTEMRHRAIKKLRNYIKENWK